MSKLIASAMSLVRKRRETPGPSGTSYSFGYGSGYSVTGNHITKSGGSNNQVAYIGSTVQSGKYAIVISPTVLPAGSLRDLAYFGISNPTYTTVLPVETTQFGLEGGSYGIRFTNLAGMSVVYEGNGDPYSAFPIIDVGDKLMMAVDFDVGKIWFGKNGTWDGDPAAGTGAALTFTPELKRLTLQSYFPDHTYKIMSDDSGYTLPSGFSWYPPNEIDPYLSNVVSLLHFNGTAGTSTILDETGLVWTPSGTTPVLTATPNKFGAGSMAFASDSFISATPSTPLGMDDFTLEGWFYLSDNRALMQIGDLLVYYSAGSYYVWNGSANIINGGSGVVGSWVYVAFVRQSGNITLFVNGAQQGTTQSYAVNMIGPAIKLGYYNGGNTAPLYIDEFRATYGVARRVNYTPTSEFPTPVAAPTDPYWSNVVLLLHGDGANGSTTITDEKGHVFTSYNGAAIATADSVFGGSSLYFSGSSNFYTADSDDWFFGTGDFTVEFWMKTSGTGPSGYACVISQYPGFVVQIQPTGVLRFYIGDPTANDILTSSAVTDGQWHFYAFTRAGGMLRAFVDGVLQTSKPDTTDMVNASVTMAIGALSEGASGIQPLTGYVDDIRITKGIARYTASFTPPTAAFPNS